jgi:hypothetical protein
MEDQTGLTGVVNPRLQSLMRPLSRRGICESISWATESRDDGTRASERQLFTVPVEISRVAPVSASEWR